VYEVKINNMHWLATPLYPKHLANCLAIKKATLTNTDYRTLWSQNDAQLKAIVAVSPASNEVKKKIERKPLVKTKTFKVSLKMDCTIVAPNERQAYAQVHHLLLKQSIDAKIEHLKTVEIIPVPTTASFEKLL